MIRALLADDEQPARDRLRRLLDSHRDVKIVDEASDGGEALEKIRRLRPDLVFLDIEMPIRNGLEVAASLAAPRPRIVFCTAYDEYAVDAFEQHALDYLLKPVNRRRLARSVDRVRKDMAEKEDLRRDLESAAEVQQHLLPSGPPGLATLDFHGACKPAQQVGGDYYDYLTLEGSDVLGVAVGDVSGKGLQAGLLMASLQARMQSCAPQAGRDLSRLFALLNQRLWASTRDNQYATLVYLAYRDRDRTAAFVNAGHQPPLLFRRAGDPVQLRTGGPPLGMFPSSEYQQEPLRLEPGDLLLLFTDGIVEAMNPRDEEFGTERLTNLVHGSRTLGAKELQEEIVRQVGRFSDGRAQHDDLTVVALKVH